MYRILDPNLAWCEYWNLLFSEVQATHQHARIHKRQQSDTLEHLLFMNNLSQPADHPDSLAVSEKQTIAIVGAGICGLCCGLALAKHGHQVTLYERDAPLPDGNPDDIFFNWVRRGAAQFKHPHAFLAVMSNLLEELFPDLMPDFFEAGARKITFQDMLSPKLKSKYRRPLIGADRGMEQTLHRRFLKLGPSQGN